MVTLGLLRLLAVMLLVAVIAFFVAAEFALVSVRDTRVQQLIEKNGTLAQLWGLRGKIYWAQQDATHAEADLLKAIGAVLLVWMVMSLGDRRDE